MSKEVTIKKAVNKSLRLYKIRGFDVDKIDTDGKFETLQEHYSALLNICAAKKHIPKIERKIKVLKERCRANMSVTPFPKLPKLLTIYLVYREAFWLNSFPFDKVEVSKDIEQKKIVTGRKSDYEKHCQLQFGDYVQTYEDTTNDMKR